MKKTLILFLIFLPITLIGQQLECCESKEDVETYLSGDWNLKNSDLKRRYRFQFNDGSGTFQIFEINENEVLEEAEGNFPTIKILKTNIGYEIEHDFTVMTTFVKIKSLDSTKLILTIDGRSEKEYLKISQ